MRCRSCCLISASFSRSRLPIVWRFTAKFPFRSFPLICVNPKKSNVAGFSSLPLSVSGLVRQIVRTRSGAFYLGSAPTRTFLAVPGILQGNGLLRLGIGSQVHCRPHSGRQRHLPARSFCARHLPTGRIRNADRYWRESVNSLPLHKR